MESVNATAKSTRTVAQIGLIVGGLGLVAVIIVGLMFVMQVADPAPHIRLPIGSVAATPWNPSGTWVFTPPEKTGGASGRLVIGDGRVVVQESASQPARSYRATMVQSLANHCDIRLDQADPLLGMSFTIRSSPTPYVLSDHFRAELRQDDVSRVATTP